MSILVDFFEEISAKAEYFKHLKRTVNIGIYGSFRSDNIAILEDFRDFLTSEGYRARMSLDLGYPEAALPEASQHLISSIASTKLRESSHIHIIFFFIEGPTEHNVNLSAAMELQALAEHEVRDVLLLFEEGLKKEDITCYFAGTVETQEGRWEWGEFARDKTLHLIRGRQFCLNRMRHYSTKFK
jgi:hypothetical protein